MRLPTPARVALAVALVAALPAGVLAHEEPTAGPPGDYVALAAHLSQPRYDTVRTTEHLVAADGEKLYLEVVRPDPAKYPDERFPVILEASPYHGTLADRDGTRILPDPVDGSGKQLGLTGYFAPRGYAVAMLDLRGTGRSTGCLDHLGQKDASDLKVAVEALAAKPWSTGRVGMTGHSYVGSTPIVAAAQRPAGLVTIVPSAGLASMYDHQFQKGVPYRLQYIGPMVAYEALALQRDLPPGSPAVPVIGGGGTADNWESAPNAQAGCGLPNSAALAGTGQVTGQYERWHGQRDWGAQAATADIPVFLVHGVNDNAARIPAAEWFLARDSRPGDKVWLGQWDHGSTNGRCGSRAGARTLHPTCRFDQWTGALHAWFDAHLQERDVDTGPPVEVFLNGTRAVDVASVVHPAQIGGKVLTASRWDAVPAGSLSLFPDATTVEGGEGKLLFQPPAAAGTATFGTTANALLVTVGAGKLTFVSAPVPHETIFLGIPHVQLDASLTTGQVIHLVATLLREDATGEREHLSTCAIQPQLRNGVTTVAPVVPASAMALPLQCFTAAHRVPAGQRLVLEVATTGPHHATFGADRQITLFTGPGRTNARLPVAPTAKLHDDVPLHRAG